MPVNHVCDGPQWQCKHERVLNVQKMSSDPKKSNGKVLVSETSCSEHTNGGVDDEEDRSQS